jgi:hypothetical protein
MRAKYAGTCSKCHGPFGVGASITRVAQGMYRHMACPTTWVDRIAGLDDGSELGQAASAGAAVALLRHESVADTITLTLPDATKIRGYACQCLEQFSDDYEFNSAEADVRKFFGIVKSRIFEAREEAVQERDQATAPNTVDGVGDER